MRQKYQEHIQNLKEQVLKEIKELIPIGTFVHFNRRFQYIPSNRWAKYRDVARLCSVYHSPTDELMFLKVYDDKAAEVFKLSLTTNKGWDKFIQQAEKGVLEFCSNKCLFDFWEEIKSLNDIGPDVLESCEEWQKMIHEDMTDKRRQEYFNMREDIDIQRRLYEYIGMFDEIYDVYHTMRKWTIEDFREWLKNRAAEWETKIENNFNGK